MSLRIFWCLSIGIYQIDKQLKSVSKLATFTEQVDFLIPKNSKRKAKVDTMMPQTMPPPTPAAGGELPDDLGPSVPSGKKISVKGFTITNRLQLCLSDPVTSQFLLHGPGGAPTGRVSEFVDTPYFRQPDKVHFLRLFLTAVTLLSLLFRFSALVFKLHSPGNRFWDS